jgi:succinyl-CoA:acetate CoA-transferase
MVVDKELQDRILNSVLSRRVTDPDTAAESIRSGMTIGTAGGYQFGYPKFFFRSLADKKKLDPEFHVDLWAAGPVGDEIDGLLSAGGILRKRLGQQANATLRKLINQRKVLFSDLRSGIFPQLVRSGSWGEVDCAVIQAVGITEEGGIIPSASLFDGASFVQMAKQVVVEINCRYPSGLYGIHDVYLPEFPPHKDVIPVRRPDDRIGTPYIPVDPGKIVHIIDGTGEDVYIPPAPPDTMSEQIGRNLVAFLGNERRSKRLPENLFPLQLGLGNIADSVARELASSAFRNLSVYTGGIGDGVLDLIDSGKVCTVSTSGLYFTSEGQKRFFEHLDRYKEVLVIRPLDIADSPEVISRLGVIAINTAIEVDIYGHVNSSHILGSKIVSGIGGSGEFAQNGALSIFLTPSTSRQGAISAVVPMASHVDHAEHSVDVIITEQGVADLRGLDPVERAEAIIRSCAHPDYRRLLRDYLLTALEKSGGHEPHDLEKAFSFHTRFIKKSTMVT